MIKTFQFIVVLLTLGFAVQAFAAAEPTKPIAGGNLVFEETDGVVAVEAEHFLSQDKSDVRGWYLFTDKQDAGVTPDSDPSHVAGASGGAYIEILPDTRSTHADKLIHGENFQSSPGKMAVLSYKVHFNNTGRYYVWARAHSTGPEDNGLHVGIDGTWPDSGQRLQWCQGKKTWKWESKQRTEKQHCGEAFKIYLDVKTPGVHTISFSMREDGFEFDKWVMTNERELGRPEGLGVESKVKSGKVPKPFPYVKPELTATTEKEVAKPVAVKSTNTQLRMPAGMFAEGKLTGYYLNNKWLAVNPDKDKSGTSEKTFPFPSGEYHLTLQTVGENDGQSSYEVSVDGQTLGGYTNPLSTQMHEEGAAFHKTWKNIQITEGAMIKVSSKIGSSDGKEYSRARWAAVSFAPANEKTSQLAGPYLKEQAKHQPQPKLAVRKGSPTKPSSDKPLQTPRQHNGNGDVQVSGELKTWHKVTLNLNGPYAHEKDNSPNPYTDYRLTATFTHEDGTNFIVPGYFAADGNAGNTSAESGTTWRAHFAPNKTGTWSYTLSFQEGELAALNSNAVSKPVTPYDGKSGSFTIAKSDKQGRDLRAHGQLKYVGKHYLQFAGSGKYFLKVGADAPETLLAFADFDNTIAGNANKAPIKTWSAHTKDWKTGDPTWGDGKGKGLIGAINYLSGKGCNAFSFLTYNAGGDGDNVWPFIQREDKLHYDCSKLDQWGTVLEHGTARGMYLHFKMQETENDDHKKGHNPGGSVPESLDGGNLGSQRKLYCRELIARFGHNLALNWNLGEENTQTNNQQLAMINYIANLDAYDHNIVVHTFPNEQDKVYQALLGEKSKLTGVSLQNSSLETTHAHTVKWVAASAKSGKPWIVAFDESGSAAHAQCPDLGYKGFDGKDSTGKYVYTQHKVRKQTLWGTLMAGGAGCEYYFGYKFAENDIVCEDWRSRDQSWDYCRIAIGFFHDNQIPFWEMKNEDALVGNPDHGVSKFCFAKSNDTYLVYLPEGGSSSLDLSGAKGEYDVQWFNPRTGGELNAGSVTQLKGGRSVSLGTAPTDQKEDWLVVVRKK
ncbi:MAG: hypothetical protein COA78_15010 [Blastopirellula sp.]|nr:MAG: hypothetical protein COA78_15010 [Blastopirellula sp.]